MKTALLHSFIWLTLLGLGIGCKEVEPVEDRLASIYPPGCQIAKTVYKTLTAGKTPNSIVDAEVITLDDGRSVEVSTSVKSTYLYDEKGRITAVENDHQVGFWQFSYKYTTSTVFFTDVYYTEKNGIKNVIRNNTDTIPLNERGLQTNYYLGGGSILFYNADDQFLKSYPVRPPDSCRYESGNCVERLRNATWTRQTGAWELNDCQRNRYSYDLTRPNLPVTHQYMGRNSKNLPIKEVWEAYRLSGFPTGPVYQKTYTYTFDEKGRVRRQVAHGKALYGGWLIVDDTGGVGVMDYEYKNCP